MMADSMMGQVTAAADTGVAETPSSVDAATSLQLPIFRKRVRLRLGDQLAVSGLEWLLTGRGLLLFSLIGLMVVAVLEFLGDEPSDRFDPISSLVFPLLIVALFVLVVRTLLWSLVRRMLKRLRNRPLSYIQQFDFCLSAKVIAVEVPPDESDAETVSSQFPWSSILAVEQDDERYLFWWKRRHAVVLPRDVFISPAEEESFRALLATWWRKEPTTPPSFRKHGSSRSKPS